MDIYNNPELYDSIHSSYKWDKNLLSTIAKEIGGPVLELGSGTGRLAEVIINLGLDYEGIDINEKLTSVAMKRFGEKANFHIGDMQNFNLKKEFKFIFVGFNSFLHNLTDQSAIKCLKCISRHLSKNGVFLLSIFIPNPSFLVRKKDTLYPATNYFMYRGSKCRIIEKNLFNYETEINKLWWYLEIEGVLQKKAYCFQQKMYYPHKMDLLFAESGFKIKKKLGDYDGSPMDNQSEMQIYICKKYN